MNTYFAAYPGKYFTGDGARRDADGYYWITGRVDDVINVSGHRMGTAEVESALVAHPKVSEAAVVGYPHDIKGQGIYAYVTLMAGVEPNEELRKELVAWVRKEIGPIASPDLIQFAPGLPKTRSGKIMRRILRKIAENEYGALGDTSTLGRSGGRRRADRQPAEPRQGLTAALQPERRRADQAPSKGWRAPPPYDAIDSSCADLDLGRQDHRLRPAFHAELLQDRGHMRFDSRLRDAELIGDLLVEQALRQHHQHTDLLRRERSEPAGERARFRLGCAFGSKSGGVHRPPSST